MGRTASTVPGTLNLVVKAGEAVSQLVDFSVDLTGYTFTGEVVSAVTFSQVVSLDVTAIDLEDGQVNVGLSAQDAAEIAPGTYLWRLVWTQPGGSPKTAIEGIWEASR